ncbi:MAG: hypothetical protein LBS25_04535, partial [Candidatus Symbiothrix sp.]|nr:hypothetical protein [Candidatus Symbiothrix sp.]
MKNLFYILSYAVVLCAMFACENSDPKESDATPQIKYVRPIDVANADILLDKAAMGSTIALIGTGLEGVNEVWFNDQKALLNPVYITSTSIIVDVPGKKPDEITNTITVKTYKGKQCVYDFTVIIPAPIPRSIENEWAHDGMQTVIFGDYFFADENGNLGDVVFPGNLVAEVITFDEQSITVIVPAGSLSGSVTVSSIYGKGRSEFTFRDKEGLFLDVEEPTKVWNTWNRSEFA